MNQTSGVAKLMKQTSKVAKVMNQTSEVTKETNATSEVAQEMDPTSSDLDSTPDMNILRQDIPSTSDPINKPQSPQKPRPRPPPQFMNQTSEAAKETNPTREVAQEMDPTSTDLDSTPDMNILWQGIPSTSDPINKSQSPQTPPPPRSRPQLPPPRSRPLPLPQLRPHQLLQSQPQPHQLPKTQPCGDLLTQPCGDLLGAGNREEYIRTGVPLYEASIKGNWKAAEAILVRWPELVRYGITENYETALHIAASAENTKHNECFVRNLVAMMTRGDLVLQNLNKNTALSLAAAAGRVMTAQIMVQKNKDLVEIPGSGGMMPLYVAALFGKYDMVMYLYHHSQFVSGYNWTDQNRGWVLQKCVQTDMFDVAQTIVADCPALINNKIILRELLQILARKPEAFSRREENKIWRIIRSIPRICQNPGSAEKHGDALQFLRIIWAKINIMPKNVIEDIIRGPVSSSRNYSSRVLFVAAEKGNTRFIVELIRAYPDLIWKKDDSGLTIFHIAVKHRHQGIYNLLYEIGSMKDLITPVKDGKGNTMLHLVGKTSVKMRSETSGASLLMQRELLWYKEVEQMMPPSYRERMNKKGETPYALFSRKNRDLVTQGLKWMKECMLVATLIVTVAFAVAFTVPGGYNQNNGIPMFVHERAFLVFVIADAISLIFSSASLLVFLSILSSRHGERDFMNSLPTKLMIGLASLFISVTAMMVTFSVSFIVLYHNGMKWVPILISVFATIPVIVFAMLQVPLLVDVFRSMYDSRYIFRPKKRMLYDINPRF